MNELSGFVENQLRTADYDVWILDTPNWGKAIEFEDASLIGGVFLFDDCSLLLDHWQSIQGWFLSHLASPLQLAPDKSWNLNLVLLSAAPAVVAIAVR